MLSPIKESLAHSLSIQLSRAQHEIFGLLEIPKDMSHGHLSLPVFFLSKEFKKAPPVIAKEIVHKLLTTGVPGVAHIEAVGGYVNFHLDNQKIFQSLYDTLILQEDRLGYSKRGEGQCVLIEYSSPNVAKPMHVGHLRATMIGQAIRNLATSQGYKVIGLNHLGDWGSQFGKLIVAYKRWGKEYPFEEEPFESLFKLYVRFHAELETQPELEAEGALAFKKLENGDAEYHQLWQKFIEISMQDFRRLWDRLGVHHDLVRGESFYSDLIPAAEKRLQAKALLTESQGAMVVDLSDEKMPPCLIRKTDGATLYATRDIASILYRFEELKVDHNITVVGAEQLLHFKQVFSVIRRLGCHFWDKCHHVSFGLYRFKDMGKMSSRKGQIIRLEDILNKAVTRVRAVIQEKNPNLENSEEVAEKVAVGAIIFNDLVNDRVRDVEFDWEKALSFDGDSGPYLQYVYVRCRSLLKKSGHILSHGEKPPLTMVDLKSEEEKNLIKTLLQYEHVLTDSYKHFKPNILCHYLLDVATKYNQVYQRHKILGGDPELLDSRLALVFCTQEVIRNGLKVLNIQTPSAM